MLRDIIVHKLILMSTHKLKKKNKKNIQIPYIIIFALIGPLKIIIKKRI